MKRASLWLAGSTLALLAVLSCLGGPASAQGVYDDWSTVKAPAPPPLAKATLDPANTALLVLDIAKQTCNPESRPRCIAMLPRVAKM